MPMKPRKKRKTADHSGTTFDSFLEAKGFAKRSKRLHQSCTYLATETGREAALG
jgi:hypothetical protein